MNDLYTLWIMPSSHVKVLLQKIILDIGAKYHGPIFEPHMTLLSDIALDKETILHKTEYFVSQLKPLVLTLSDISMSTTYFQCVFIQVKASAELLDANMKAKEIFGCRNDLFMPHISLVYGNYSMGDRETIASEIILPHTMSFTADEILIVPTKQDPKEWQHIASLKIK